MKNQHHIHRSSQCGGHVLYCSRIRKNVTEKTQRTDREQRTEKAIREATLIPWIAGLSGPIKPTTRSDWLDTLPIKQPISTTNKLIRYSSIVT